MKTMIKRKEDKEIKKIYKNLDQEVKSISRRTRKKFLSHYKNNPPAHQGETEG